MPFKDCLINTGIRIAEPLLEQSLAVGKGVELFLAREHIESLKDLVAIPTPLREPEVRTSSPVITDVWRL
jgi:hypothetical protein